MRNYELEVQRKNTARFIQADPVRLVLFAQNRIPLADGGFKKGPPTARNPQTFRLIPQSDVMPQVQTPDGVQLTPTYVLLGEHEAEMARWDRFSIGEVNFMIVGPIRPDYTLEAYDRKGDVARL